AIKEEVPEEQYVTPIGEAGLIRSGEDVTIVAWGSMLREVGLAADLLEEEGVHPEVLDLRALVPMDADALAASVEKTHRAVIVHEAPRTAGLAGEVIALIQERALYSLEAPIGRVTGWDTVFPLKRSEHLYFPSVERIAQEIRRVMAA
ncbi:MAG: transketolase C-terminal domain-containing protein, partial [Actinomycetota bacterium]